MFAARGEQYLVRGRDLGGIVDPALQGIQGAEDDRGSFEALARVGDEDLQRHAPSTVGVVVAVVDSSRGGIQQAWTRGQEGRRAVMIMGGREGKGNGEVR